MNSADTAFPPFAPEAPVTSSTLPSSAAEIAEAINANVESWHAGAKSPEAFRADNLSLWRRAFDLKIDKDVSNCMQGGTVSLVFG